MNVFSWKVYHLCKDGVNFMYNKIIIMIDEFVAGQQLLVEFLTCFKKVVKTLELRSKPNLIRDRDIISGMDKNCSTPKSLSQSPFLLHKLP